MSAGLSARKGGARSEDQRARVPVLPCTSSSGGPAPADSLPITVLSADTTVAIVMLVLRPAVAEDDVDEIVTDERIVEVLQHIGIDGPEGATRPVLHTIGERPQDPGFEIGSRMCSGAGLNCVCGQIVTTDAQHISLDTRCDKGD